MDRVEKNKPKPAVRKGLIIGAVLTIIFLTIGVPIIINEAYKCNSGYITMWTAADVLSYYGTVLGSLIAVATLAITILFTRKQIQRDSYLQSEEKKWARIEAVITQSLDDINPFPIITEILDSQKITHDVVFTFGKYQITCQLVTDKFSSFTNDKDRLRIKPLSDKIGNLAKHFSSLAGSGASTYRKFHTIEAQQLPEELMNIDPAELPPLLAEQIAFCQKQIKESEGLSFSGITKEFCEIGENMTQLYYDEYKPLLKEKGSIFDEIYNEIQEEADSLLLFRRKKECQRLNGLEKKK